MAEDGRVVIKIDGDAKGYDNARKGLESTTNKAAGSAKREVDSLEQSVEGIGSAAESSSAKAAQKLSSIGSGLTDVGGKLTKGVTAPILAIGTASFASSLKFEDAMAKVDTIADTSEKSLDELRTEILKLSDDTGIAASDIAGNVYDAISAGQKTGDAVEFVGKAAQLAKAGFTDSASALDVLTTTLTAYKLESDPAGRVSDELLQTQNKGKVTVGELSASMGRAIPTAAAFNVNLENLAAAYATTTA